MADPYVGEIRMFGGSFAPAGWAFCDGQLLAISENDTLFTLIGTTYGGDGQSTFALPDLRGRLPMHAGTGPGLSNHQLGEKAGTESVTLSTQQIPAHTHVPGGAVATATTGSPAGGVWAATTAPAYVPFSGTATNAMAADVVAPTGGSQPHENRSPAVAVSFIISLYGIYPTQN